MTNGPHTRTLVFLLGMLLLPSCGREGEGVRVVRFWALGAEGDNVRALIPEFERRNPGIRVIVQAIPWTAAHEKLLTSYAGNSMPDVFQLGNTWVPEFHILGAIEDLRPFLRTSATVREASYFPGIWSTNVMDSAVLGIPWYVDTRVLFYRTDLFAAAGYMRPPASWDEWLELSKRLRAMADAQGREAYAILMPTNEWAPPVILGMQTGSEFLKDQNTRGDFSNPAFRRAFEFYSGFFRQKLAPVGITQVTNVFQGLSEGFFAMYITGPWNVGEFRRRLPPSMQDRWMTATLPSPDGLTPGTSLAGGSSLAMSRSAVHKEAVWKLIEYLSDPPQQLAFYRLTGDLPAHRAAWEDSSLARDPTMQAFSRQLNYVSPVPKIPEWEQIAMKLQQYAEVASVGHTPLPEVLSELDREVDIILDKRRWLVHGR